MIIEQTSKILSLVPIKWRPIVVIIALLCGTNVANHYVHAIGEEETRESLEKLVRDVYEVTCKEES